MGRKIFVSYKYKDTDVYPLDGNRNTNVRAYVDKIEDYLDSTDDIYKGESDDEDLSHLSDDTIWEKLKDRIYDSSVTIVIISPKMKERKKTDNSQWIPWEISYSLKEITRADRVSRSNAILAVTLPDSNGSYEYFIKDNSCCDSPCRTLKRYTLFDILRKNMFNQKQKQTKPCDEGKTIYYGDSSFIRSVKWSYFVNNAQSSIDKAVEIKEKIDEYDICKEV